jgi:hypothetical protein
MASATADIYLAADVAATGGIARALLRNKPTGIRDHLSMRLWEMSHGSASSVPNELLLDCRKRSGCFL